MAAVSYPKALQWWSSQDPEKVAVVCDDQIITRGELDRCSNRLARIYKDLGVAEGDRVTICVPNSIEFIQICFATWKLGATPQPLSSQLPENELQGLIALAEPALVVGVDRAYGNRPTVFQCLLSGGKAVLMPRFDAAEAIGLIEQYAVDWVLFVPTMMHRIWRLDEAERQSRDMSSLRIVNSTAAPVADWLKRAWIEWIGAEKIYESYGGSERIGGTQIIGTDWLTHPGSVGTPVGGAAVRILDTETHQLLSAGEIGEVYMRAAASAAKSTFYVGAEEQEYDGFQTLGDMGYLDEEGYLYLVDRRVDMIISGGANIYPAEIECVIDEYANVRSSAVVGLPDDDLGQRVHAIVDAPGGLDEEALLKHLNSQLVRYKVPRSLEVVDELLRDDSGKVRRSALRDARL